MKTLRYQVVVVEYARFSQASIPDLKCQALGANPTDAIAAVRELARRALNEYDGRTVNPPRPGHLTLAHVELPAPMTKRDPRHGRRLKPVPAQESHPLRGV